MYYVNSWPLSYEFYYRKIRFLLKLKSSENVILSTLYNVNGGNEVSSACNAMNISADSLKLCNLKNNMWAQFALNLDN